MYLSSAGVTTKLVRVWTRAATAAYGPWFVLSQYSPSNLTKSHSCRKMFCLRARQGFSKRVRGLVVGGAINQLDGAGLNNVTNEVVAYVDVFRACVIVAAVRECDG
jgi:hypothetical protein